MCAIVSDIARWSRAGVKRCAFGFGSCNGRFEFDNSFPVQPDLHPPSTGRVQMPIGNLQQPSMR